MRKRVPSARALIWTLFWNVSWPQLLIFFISFLSLPLFFYDKRIDDNGKESSISRPYPLPLPSCIGKRKSKQKLKRWIDFRRTYKITLVQNIKSMGGFFFNFKTLPNLLASIERGVHCRRFAHTPTPP